MSAEKSHGEQPKMTANKMPFATVEEAQAAMCPKHKVYAPNAENAAVYEELYQLYRRVYFAFGDDGAAAQGLADVLKSLREIAAKVREGKGVYAA